jgi:hypothetical protein
MKLMFVNKILSKYIYVRSCLEVFIVKNIMVQSEFNLDISFSTYDFFVGRKLCIFQHANQ